MRNYLPSVHNCDCVLIFASYGFLVALGPLLVGYSKLVKKPCYIRAFAGSLDQYFEALPWATRRMLLLALHRSDGLIVQTEKLHNYFNTLLDGKVFLMPGYRELSPSRHDHRPIGQFRERDLRLIYVASVKEDKGVFTLLDSMELISHTQSAEDITCDIYGPVHPECEAEFFARVSDVPGVQYAGTLNFDDVISTMAEYDALVLPTRHQGEGHPGVIIEAMNAGIPVITTRFQSIPEVVQHRENGLLISSLDAQSLANAIETIHHDRDLLVRMAQNNYARRKQHDIRHITSQLLEWLDFGDYSVETATSNEQKQTVDI